ncbi:hypothetical protein [Amycolatopsis sp. 195334CR]|uniref:hypothetical protein n=1 Tax=Amycolatopsis sp. 195334CR TaxID=2814588 RepID=UPI001F5CB016|nr:hypothetical protein [Amycolatopsis sp. 195334CR]
MTRSQDRLLAQWRAEPIRESKVRSCLRLARLGTFATYLSPFVVFTALLGTTAQFSVSVFAMLLCFTAGGSCLLASFGHDPGEHRPPFALTSSEVRWFGWGAAFAGVLLWTTAVLISPFSPVWTIVLIALTATPAVVEPGLPEPLVAVLGGVVVLAPYALATGTLHPFVVVQAVVFGLGTLLARGYATGSPNTRLVAVLAPAEFLAGAIGSLLGAAPWWFVVAMAPATALRALQYHRFRTGDLETARALGLRAHRLSALLMVLSNLLVLALG